jgi:hypothetical protein
MNPRHLGDLGVIVVPAISASTAIGLATKTAFALKSIVDDGIVIAPRRCRHVSLEPFLQNQTSIRCCIS